MKDHYDIAIIGTGPAGMAAATVASAHGADVLIVDEQPEVGGQIYRGITRQSIKDKTILGDDYYKGQSLADAFAASNADHVSGATVWQVSPEREIGISKDGAAHLLTADQVIIATGAQERPFPIPGWTLPGVMTAGSAQILLKSSGITFSNAVFAGTGPLLYLIAYQYLKAGVPIRAILDTTPKSNRLKALPHLPGALYHLSSIMKGRKWIKALKSSGTLFIEGIDNLKITGKDSTEAIEYLLQNKWHRIEASNVFLHQGVVPNVNLAMASGCMHHWNEQKLCWHASTDEWGSSNVPGISIAGDGGGIGGAIAAEYQGRITAYQALYTTNKVKKQERDINVLPTQHALTHEMRIRPFLDVMFRPATQYRIPTDDATIVCRCEEVTAGKIRESISLGCAGPNQLKGFTRCGMGPCQGRFCSLSVSELIAKAQNVSVNELEQLRLRPPVKPLMLAELANLTTLASEDT